MSEVSKWVFWFFCWRFVLSQRLSGLVTSPMFYLDHFYSFLPITWPLFLFLTWFKKLPPAVLLGRFKICIYHGFCIPWQTCDSYFVRGLLSDLLFHLGASLTPGFRIIFRFGLKATLLPSVSPLLLRGMSYLLSHLLWGLTEIMCISSAHSLSGM